jgi:Zinc finger, C2H2 type/C2H2-type zinc finger
VKQFKCDKCGDTFVRVEYLRKHKQRHTRKKRTFKCTFCPERVASKRNLQKHILEVHGKVKKFVCTICKAKFSRKQVLDNHILYNHNDEYKFPCDRCLSKYKTQGDLNKHIITHDNKEKKNFKVEENHLAEVLDTKYKYDQSRRIYTHEEDAVSNEWSELDFYIISDKFGNEFPVLTIVENDEYQHDYYGVNKELSRMDRAFKALKSGRLDGVPVTKPVLFIRYSCIGSYKEDGLTVRTTKKHREDDLMQLLEAILNKQLTFNSPITIVYLYYNLVDGVPEIVQHNDYDDKHKEMIRLIDSSDEDNLTMRPLQKDKVLD